MKETSPEAREAAMTQEEVKEIIEKLLGEIEEEDIGISLFSTYYQTQQDLTFFSPEDRERVLMILKRLSDDSRHHKAILQKVIEHLEKIHEN